MWLLLIGLGAFALFLSRDKDASPTPGGPQPPIPPGTLPGGIPNPWPGFPTTPPPGYPPGMPWPPVLPGGATPPGMPSGGLPPLWPGFPATAPPGWPAGWPWPGAAIPGGQTPGGQTPGGQTPTPGSGGGPGVPWPGFPGTPPPGWPAGVPWPGTMVPGGTTPSTPTPGGTGPNGEPMQPKPNWWPSMFPYPGYIPNPQWPGLPEIPGIPSPTPGGTTPVSGGMGTGNVIPLEDMSLGGFTYVPGKKLVLFLDAGANSAQQLAQGQLFSQQNPSTPIGAIHAELASGSVSKQAYNVTKLPSVIAFNGTTEIGRRDTLQNAAQLAALVK